MKTNNKRWINRLNVCKFLAILIISSFSAIIFSCGGDNSGNGRSAPEFLVVKDANVSGMNQELAKEGEKLFETKCTACHKYDERFVGPALRDVTEKRSPEFILSMITDPEQMVKKNETARELLKDFATPMTNQNINLEQAKAIYYHLKSISNQK